MKRVAKYGRAASIKNTEALLPPCSSVLTVVRVFSCPDLPAAQCHSCGDIQPSGHNDHWRALRDSLPGKVLALSPCETLPLPGHSRSSRWLRPCGQERKSL